MNIKYSVEKGELYVVELIHSFKCTGLAQNIEKEYLLPRSYLKGGSPKNPFFTKNLKISFYKKVVRPYQI